MATYTITVPRISNGNKAGPASYATGGFELDLTATFSFLDFLKLEVETPGSLPHGLIVVEKNVDGSGNAAPGKARIKVMRGRYDKFSIGTPTGNPSGTTVAASKTAAGTTTGSSHTHTMDHDHPSATSSAPVGGAGNANAAGAGNMSLHTHDVDIAAFTGSTAAATHTHDRSFEYEHDHSVTNTETDTTLVELASTTNISTTTFRYLAVGQ